MRVHVNSFLFGRRSKTETLSDNPENIAKSLCAEKTGAPQRAFLFFKLEGIQRLKTEVIDHNPTNKILRLAEKGPKTLSLPQPSLTAKGPVSEAHLGASAGLPPPESPR